MSRLFYIGIGGAVGALLRYWVSGVALQFLNGGFPWGTLSVNAIGSFIIGFLWGMLETVVVSQNIKVLLLIGVLGSFTTFSTFSIECFHLIRDGEYGYFIMNTILNFVLGIVLVFAGYFLSRYSFNLVH